MQRVVVDTNVWVSAVLNPAGHPARVLEALRARRFNLLVSQPMLDELRDVLLRPRLTRKYGITVADVHELILLWRGPPVTHCWPAVPGPVPLPKSGRAQSLRSTERPPDTWHGHSEAADSGRRDP